MEATRNWYWLVDHLQEMGANASGGKVWHGRLSQQANLILKWAMVEVAMRAGTCEPWRGYYSRLKRNKGMPVARVPLARKVAKMIYHMLKYNLDYSDYIERGHLAR